MCALAAFRRWCVCVCERERECVRACIRVRVAFDVCTGSVPSMVCVCVKDSVCVRASGRVYVAFDVCTGSVPSMVCVCVCVRERERECVSVCMWHLMGALAAFCR